MSLMKSAAVPLFLVMDPLGNIPTFLSLLSGLEPRRARRILLRELLIALAVLIVFLLLGRASSVAADHGAGVERLGRGDLVLDRLEDDLRGCAGYFREIVGRRAFRRALGGPVDCRPLRLGHGVAAHRPPANEMAHLVGGHRLGAWFASGLILYFASSFGRVLGKRGTAAIQVLAGMLLTTMAVQMFLTGIRQFFS